LTDLRFSRQRRGRRIAASTASVTLNGDEIVIAPMPPLRTSI
jgi:hypothetical protein